jgi:hypothetical protein
MRARIDQRLGQILQRHDIELARSL